MGRVILVLVLMILGHLLADYPLQGWLAQAKQKSWWEKNAPDEQYQYDYIPALICHSTMWAIIVFAPIMYYSWFELEWFWVALPINIAIHCFIDDLKANKKAISLCQDQLFHLSQIATTWVLWFLIIGVV